MAAHSPNDDTKFLNFSEARKLASDLNVYDIGSLEDYLDDPSVCNFPYGTLRRYRGKTVEDAKNYLAIKLDAMCVSFNTLRLIDLRQYLGPMFESDHEVSIDAKTDGTFRVVVRGLLATLSMNDMLRVEWKKDFQFVEVREAIPSLKLDMQSRTSKALFPILDSKGKEVYVSSTLASVISDLMIDAPSLGDFVIPSSRPPSSEIHAQVSSIYPGGMECEASTKLRALVSNARMSLQLLVQRLVVDAEDLFEVNGIMLR